MSIILFALFSRAFMDFSYPCCKHPVGLGGTGCVGQEEESKGRDRKRDDAVDDWNTARE